MWPGAFRTADTADITHSLRLETSERALIVLTDSPSSRPSLSSRKVPWSISWLHFSLISLHFGPSTVLSPLTLCPTPRLFLSYNVFPPPCSVFCILPHLAFGAVFLETSRARECMFCFNFVWLPHASFLCLARVAVSCYLQYRFWVLLKLLYLVLPVKNFSVSLCCLMLTHSFRTRLMVTTDHTG